jgi:hypothetical protein
MRTILTGDPNANATEVFLKQNLIGIGGLRVHIGIVSVLPGTSHYELRSQLPPLGPILFESFGGQQELELVIPPPPEKKKGAD